MPARTPSNPPKKPARPSKSGGAPRKPSGQSPKPGGKSPKPGGQGPKPGGRAPKPARASDRPAKPARDGDRPSKPARSADKPAGRSPKPARGRKARVADGAAPAPESLGRRAGRGRPAGEGPAEGRPGDRGPRAPREQAAKGPKGSSAPRPPEANDARAAREPPRPNLGDWDADVADLDEGGDDIFGWSGALEDDAHDDDAPTRRRPPPRIAGGREARPAAKSPSAKSATAGKPAPVGKPAAEKAKPSGRAAKPAAGAAKPATGTAKSATGTTKSAAGTARPAAGATKSARPKPEGPQLSLFPNPRVRLRIVHEDPAFLVVHKPAGVVTQPGEGHARDTLLNGLFVTHGTILQNIGRHRDFGLLHRLDRATSGLVLVALTAEAYDNIRKQFADRVVKKTYVTLVHGAPNPPDGTERTPIYESRDQGRKRAKLGEHSTAQPAITKYKTLVRAKGLTLVECHPETGRLHQIRVHMAYRGCPVIADDDYGFAGWDAVDHTFAKLTGRAQFLHAAEISFVHPTTGKRITFSEPLPPEWVTFLAAQGITCPNKYRGAIP